MQKIKLKNGTEINNVLGVNANIENIGENDRRDVFQLSVLDNTVENLDNLMFFDTSVLEKISIYDADSDELQGVHERYTVPCSITKNILSNCIEIKIARKSNLEQQLLETQLALAELGQIIGEVL